MISDVAIRGDGMAATCCARLLERRGIPFSIQPNSNPARTRPTLLINPQTQKLLADVFERQPDFLMSAHPVRRRAVLWGAEACEPKWFPHAGYAVREASLLEELWANLRSDAGGARSSEWTIESIRAGTEHSFGTRTATTCRVRLKEAENDTCSIESLSGGWLFLVPGSLIAVGETPEALLSASRLIAPQIAGIDGTGTQFPCYPRISIPLSGPGWLACGAAAMSFDPICGEGAGHAIREAILATAVLGRIHAGADPEVALREYNTRLLAGFMRHLELCRQFYVSGRQSEWWDVEIQALDRGLAWTRAQLVAAPSPSARLIGFDLVESA